MFQAPLAPATPEPSKVGPSYNLTELPASAVPETIMAFAAPGVPDVRVGATGASVSTLTFNAVDEALTLPAASAALPVKIWLPSTRVPVANDQAPLVSAAVVPICVAPSKTRTVLPA